MTGRSRAFRKDGQHVRLGRRTVLKAGLAMGAAAAVARAASARADAPPMEVLDVKTISWLSERYHGWPTVARRKNGQLLLTYSGGREGHVCPFGRVEMMTSNDAGQTWTFPRVLLDSAIDDRDSGVLETAQGTLLVTTFTSLAYQSILENAEAARDTDGAWPEDRLARWQAVHRRLDAKHRESDLGVWMLRSTNGGVTWSARYDCLVNSPHGPIQLEDGRLLYAGKDLWRGGRVGFCQSTDDGVSWEWLATLPVREGDNSENYHELHVVECPSGRLVAQIRNHNSANSRETLQSESEDGGHTWSVPHAIGVWGLPSHLLRLEDGRLLMTYGHRREPFGCQARISDDEGRNWSEAMILYGDGAGGDLGYPSTVELADSTLLSVWYELMAGTSWAVLRQARWHLKA